jgi:ATP-binding cassette subfamily B (MDR/TAP) protein 1
MSLFNFTTRKDTLVLVLSTIFAVVVGTVTPIQSYLLGQVFGNFAKFAAGTLSETKFKHDMLAYNLYFVGLGTISWVFTAFFFASWLLFGQLQARGARERLFDALIDRKIEWFDQRKDGIGAMTTKLQR